MRPVCGQMNCHEYAYSAFIHIIEAMKSNESFPILVDSAASNPPRIQPAAPDASLPGDSIAPVNSPPQETPASRLRILLVKDVDALSSSRLVDNFIQASKPRFDAIIACGPLSHRDKKTEEDEAMALGDVSSVLAHLENLACRIIYLGAPSDPAEAIYREIHLTPNALNLHARWVDLVPGMRVGGYTERSQLDRASMDDEEEGEHEADDAGEEEAEEARERVQGGRSAAIVREVLLSSSASSIALSPSPVSSSAAPPHELLPTSIFILQSQHMHTTNQLLFFSQEELRHASVSTIIVPHMGGSGSVSNSTSLVSRDSGEQGSVLSSIPQPRDILGVRAIFLGSLREHRAYTELEFSLCERSCDGNCKERKWILVNTSLKTI